MMTTMFTDFNLIEEQRKLMEEFERANSKEEPKSK